MAGFPAWLSNQKLFAHSSPFLMVCFLVLSPWANIYHLCWTRLINPSNKSFDFGVVSASNRTVGFTLLVMSTLLKATWFGAWVQILVITWFCDRKWKPQMSSRDIMQVDWNIWQDTMESSRGRWIPYEEGRDLPVYDHYCAFLNAAVYLRTIKPYLYVAVFLQVDAVFSLAVSVFALANYQVPAVPFAISVIMEALLAMLGSLMLTYDRIWFLAFKNLVGPERLTPAWVLGFKYDERGETRLHLQRFEGRDPWDLGISENLHQVLGRHWWQWVFFWWQPERVFLYGRYRGRDLPYADWVIRYRTDFLMVPLVHAAIDDGSGASPSHGQAPVYRRLQRSTRSSSHTSDDSTPAAPTPAVPASPAPALPAPAAARSGRRRFEFSFSSNSQ
ncbi:hypothetical protein DL764_003921 [Monosporascus ibericus]|uniref:Protein S-acyltransferase n=1 Tax=Monosporascus ibericus TaxID=155417 RepID=A0A4Q4TI85_9PEZI|nr:hypothetical protein DL764_003921 [Monosporascus ibericus]